MVELSSSSPLSAAAVRVVDKLIPFYGGTLSEDDRTKLALFQKIEYTSQVPISPSLVGWNPTADLSPLEPSRLAALGAVQTAFIKRACLRVCASSSTIFPEDHDAITYDPVFFLSFVEQAIAHDELKLSDWIAIVESGALSVTVAALASSSTSHRLVARATIQALLKKLEVSWACSHSLMLSLTPLLADPIVHREGRACSHLHTRPQLYLQLSRRSHSRRHRSLPRELRSNARHARVAFVPRLYALLATATDPRSTGRADVLHHVLHVVGAVD